MTKSMNTKEHQKGAAPGIVTALAILVVTSGCFYSLDRQTQLRPGEISGQAVNAAGQPVPFANVAIIGTPLRITANANGEFVTKSPSEGTWTLRLTVADDDGAVLLGAFTQTSIRRLQHAGETDPRLTSVALGRVVLAGTAVLGGVVTANGDPVAFARVNLQRVINDEGEGVVGDSEHVTTTSEDGTFEFQSLVPGAILLNATAVVEGESFVSRLREVDVTSSSPAITLELDPAIGERPVEVRTNPQAADGDDVLVTFTGLGSPQEFDALTFDAAIGGPWNIQIENRTQQRIGVVSGVVVPRSASPLQIGIVTMAPVAGQCETVGAFVDCDGDGVVGLPNLIRNDDGTIGSEDLALWQDCAQACGLAEEPTCVSVVGGGTPVVFDCDDDGDGQSDLTEPPECYGVGRSTDADGDGICDSVDARPGCNDAVSVATCILSPPRAPTWHEYTTSPLPRPRIDSIDGTGSETAPVGTSNLPNEVPASRRLTSAFVIRGEGLDQIVRARLAPPDDGEAIELEIAEGAVNEELTVNVSNSTLSAGLMVLTLSTATTDATAQVFLLQGEPGPATVSQSEPAAVADCPTGGRTITIGVDADNDGIPDVGATRNHVCNGLVGDVGDVGAAAPSIASQTVPALLADCPNGGQTVVIGTDADNDGQPDVGATPIHACNGAQGDEGPAGPPNLIAVDETRVVNTVGELNVELTSLRAVRIAPRATVTLQLPAGMLTVGSPIVLNHPDVEHVLIVGAPTTLVCASECFVADHVGAGASLRDLTLQGASPQVGVGISATNGVVTAQDITFDQLDVGLVALGTGTIYAALSSFSDCNGLVIADNSGAAFLSNSIATGVLGNGIDAQGRSVVIANDIELVSVVPGTFGVGAGNGAIVQMAFAHVTGFSEGVFASGSASVSVDQAIIDDGNRGIVAENGSSVTAVGATIENNTADAVLSNDNSSVNLLTATITGNGNDVPQTNNGGVVR